MRALLLPLWFLSACCDCEGDTSEKANPCPDWEPRFEDADGDGLGYESVPVCAAGGVANQKDCDDSDPAQGGPGPLYEDEDVDGYGSGFVVGEGCPTWKYSASSTDCDDEDPNVNPGAPEQCDGLDNDCDTATGEDGLATFIGESGASDKTSALTGAAEVPAELTLDEPGTLNVCAGTWYVRLIVSNDVAVEAPAGAFLTTLDGAGSGTVVTVQGARGRSVALRGFTITGGAGENGGGLSCDGDHILSLDDDVFVGNTAERGGALANDGCTLYQFRGSFSSNTATVGGAAWVGGGYTEFNNTTFEDNEATEEGGAIAADAGASGAFVGVHTVLIEANTAPAGGAIALRGPAEMQIFGDATSGVFRNTSVTGGVITTDARSLVEFITLDLGITGSERDNSPIDVSTIPGDYAIEDGVTGWCNAEGCVFL
ncbi:hypothetical protein LBMAG42_05420 [Deltaproteobacteria bacterium]|nr:hypothetical protein LBMAG42_05420 [Deltaproteobacteria bacterium]